MKRFLLGLLFLIGAAFPAASQFNGCPPGFCSGTASAPALPRLANNKKMVPFGDSLMAFGQTTSGNPAYLYGLTTWTLNAIGGRLYMPVNLGVAGDTLTMIIARLSTLAATSPDVVVADGGINDLLASNRTSAQMIADWTTIINAIMAMNSNTTRLLIQPLIMGNNLNAGQITIGNAVNAFLASQAGTFGGRIKVTDVSTVTDADLSDHIHPSDSVGAKKVGELDAAQLAGWVDTASFVDQFFAGTNYAANPTWSGTGGTINGGFTGSTAASTVGFFDNGGATLVASKEAITDKQIFTFSGNYTGNFKNLLWDMFPIFVPSIANTPMEGIIEFDITAPLTNIISIGVLMTTTDSSFNNQNNPSYSYQDFTNTMALSVGETYIMRTPPRTAPALADKVVLSLMVVLKDAAVSTPVAGAIRLRRATARKVP